MASDEQPRQAVAADSGVICDMANVGVGTSTGNVQAIAVASGHQARPALRVLVVEDNAMIATLLAEILEDLGYDVYAIAATEDGAVADAARCRPSLMIVDEHLLEGSGLSAVERILRTGPVPCVFISGAPLRLSRLGATVLQKPFFEGDLVRAIRQVVAGANVAQSVPPASAHAVRGR